MAQKRQGSIFTRDWGSFAPAGVIFIVGMGLAVAGLQNHSRGQHASNAHRYKAFDLERLSSSTVARVEQRAPEPNPTPIRSEWREEQDLKAQRQMADWAFWMLCVTGVGVTITLAGVIYVKKTLDLNRALLLETAKGAAAAYDAYVAEHRAWLKVTLRKASVEFRGDEIKVSISVEATNMGRSPATEVHIGATAYQSRRFVVASTGLKAALEREALIRNSRGPKNDNHAQRFGRIRFYL